MTLTANRRESADRLFLLGLLVLTALGAGLRLYGVAQQPPLLDETNSAFTAENYLQHGLFGPTMPFHPNLRNLVLYASTRLAGTGAVGLRGPSLLMGTLTIPLLGLVLARLIRDHRAAMLAMFFLAVDPVHVTFSRQAIQEVHTTFLLLVGVWFFLLAYDPDWRLMRPGWLPAAGIAFGLSAASKAHGLFPLVVCLGLALWLAGRSRRTAEMTLVVSSLTALPFAVYLLTYWPWFRRGYRLSEWFPMQWAQFGEMIEHAGYTTSSMLDTRPWQWFLRPLMGYGNFTQVEGVPVITIAMGNPLVWLLVLPASVYLFRRQKHRFAVVVLQLLFWASYLPLALSGRPVWLLSAVAVLPFAFGLVGLWLSRILPHRATHWLAAYLSAVLLVSLLLYPMAIGRAWDYGYLRPLAARFNPHP